MSYIQRPKSDLGTIFVHWAIAAALLGAALTGLSIASADNPGLWVLPYVGFLLSRENVWFLHLVFGIALLSSLMAYFIYIRRANLTGRVLLGGARLSALRLGGPSRCGAVNVVLYWVLFIALAFEIAAGALLFFGFGGVVLTLHLHFVWLFLAFPFVHAIGHWLYGGLGQLLRIFTPQWRLPQRDPLFVDALIERIQQLEAENASPAPLDKPAGNRRAKQLKPLTIAVPLAIAVVASATMVPFSTFLEKQSRQTLKIVKISAADAPTIDGDLSGAAWRRAPVITVLTQHGANFDKGESKVEIRALHDGEFVYFAFTWTDPTRSLMHMPLVKREDGWRLMRSAGPGNEARIHEDKFAVLLAPGGQPLIGKGIHLGPRPLADKPESPTGRGLHFIEGGVGDIWQWRASHGGLLGWIDNGHFGAPLPASAGSSARRYTGGFALDGGPLPYQDNFEIASNEEAYPLVRPLRLPASAALILRLSSFNLDPEYSDASSSRPWLTPQELQCPTRKTLTA